MPTWKGFTSRPFPFSPLRSVHTGQYSLRGCLQIPKTRGPSVSSLPPTHCVLVEGSPPLPPRHHRGMVGFHVCPSPAEPFLDFVFYRPENCWNYKTFEVALHQAPRRFLQLLYLKAWQQVVWAYGLLLCNKHNVKLWKPGTWVGREENSSLTMMCALQMLCRSWGEDNIVSVLNGVKITMCAQQTGITM